MFVPEGHVNLGQMNGGDLSAKAAMSSRNHDVFLGAADSQSASAEARKLAMWMPTSCAEVDVDVHQILGVSVVPRNVCWQLKPFASLVHSAFVAVAGVPPP